MTVAELMTQEVQTVRMDTTLREIRSVFQQRSFHHLVVTEDDVPVGVISDRDVLKNLSPFLGHRMMERAQDKRTLDKRVHQIMSRQLVTIRPDATAEQAVEQMSLHGVSCLPVVDARDKLVGILTWKDLARSLIVARTA
jgi:acetoin utilization protein AcuB